MSKFKKMVMVPSTGSLEAYIQAVRSIPVVDPQEEKQLARRFRDCNDLDAARRLVTSHLRFVVYIAQGYSGYGLSQADLIQEGNIGLMKAVKRFDPEQGVRLISFAVHWIRAEIHEFILRNWRIVKVATTKAQRKLFFNMRRAKKSLGWMNRNEIETVAQDLGVSPQTVAEMEQRLHARDASFDPNPADSQDTDPAAAPVKYLPDLSYDPARQVEDSDHEVYQTTRLYEALKGLDDRSRKILESRWLAENKKTLQELADEYHVSAERIRQLEKAALKKLQANLTV